MGCGTSKSTLPIADATVPEDTLQSKGGSHPPAFIEATVVCKGEITATRTGKKATDGDHGNQGIANPLSPDKPSNSSSSLGANSPPGVVHGIVCKPQDGHLATGATDHDDGGSADPNKEAIYRLVAQEVVAGICTNIFADKPLEVKAAS
jgi:hypothetical protein